MSIDAAGEEFSIGYAYGIVETSDIDRLQGQYVRVTKLLLGTLLHIHALEQTHAREKIAFLLVYIARQLGVSLWQRSDDVKIVVTQQEIANMLGIARETANLELKKLEALELITGSRKCYIVHTKRMYAYLELG